MCSGYSAGCRYRRQLGYLSPRQKLGYRALSEGVLNIELPIDTVDESQYRGILFDRLVIRTQGMNWTNAAAFTASSLPGRRGICPGWVGSGLTRLDSAVFFESDLQNYRTGEGLSICFGRLGGGRSGALYLRIRL